MRILLWHVHGSWTTAFVQGPHEYLLPVLPDRGPDGLGRARTWDWPASVREIPADRLRDEPIDLVILQRPHEAQLAQQWTGRRPGVEVPAVYLEHNAPDLSPCGQRHPLADQRGIAIVHVTQFNRMMWDNGAARTAVIEHGIVDPGPSYTGTIAAAAVVLNDPLRRGRVVGADLLPAFARVAPVDLFGMRVTEFVRSDPHALAGVTAYEDVPQAAMHRQLAERAVYLHPIRWTSLGLALIEAMQLAMPVVALATTETPAAVPPEAGVVSNDLDVLTAAVRMYLAEPEAARAAGRAGRAAALARYGLPRFIEDWDALIKEATA